MKNITNILFLLFLIVIISCVKNEKILTEKVSIVPKPINFEKLDGYFEINKKTKLVIPNDPQSEGIANYFAVFLKQVSGIELATTYETVKKNQIVFSLEPGLSSNKEAYQIEVGEENIFVKASSPVGLFYGIQTLFQLLPPDIFDQQIVEKVKWIIPCCKIVDEPRFGWRGMHLDVSRHFFPVEFIKKYIDLIAMHKMNVFHWHLTDDNGWRMEVKKYPKLTEVSAWRVDREDVHWREVTPPKKGEEATYGGFYTQEEIRDVVAYAAERFITVIPEIEMPGHTSEVFAAYPELSCTGEQLYVQPGSYWPNSDIFCAGNEQVFTFLENVIDEVIELFPAPYIHIGGDEATKTHWEECPKCQDRIKNENLENEHELQSYFIKRMEKYINDKGKQIIGWDEILEGGLAPGATVMSWRGMQGGIDAAKLGHDVIMSPVSHCYFDYYQGNPDFEPLAIGGFTSLKKVYSFEPIPPELSDEDAKHVLGGQGNVWTEYIPTPEHAEYMAVPRMTALAEVLWSQKENKDWVDFRERLEVQMKRFFARGINYSFGSWKVEVIPHIKNGGYEVALESEQGIEPIHYTLDGLEPTQNSTEYSSPLNIDKTTTIKAGIFVNGELKEYVTTKEIVLHKAVSKSARLKTPPARKYFGHGANSLVDGLKGSDNYRDGYWIGFQGEDMDLEIDLGESVNINTITTSFFQNTGAWVFFPEKVKIEILNENKKVLAKSVLVPDASSEVKGSIIDELIAEYEEIRGRYIIIHAKNIKTIPTWHPGAGNKSWIFADEVIVE